MARETRDLLAGQARRRGVSLSSLLADVVRQVERDVIFRSEREASRADAGDPRVRDEERDWEATLTDGLD